MTPSTMGDAHTPEWRTIAIDRFTERTGELSVLEFGKHFSFVVKRVFWVSGVPDRAYERGRHAHEELCQVLFCAHGDCEIEVEARDGAREVFTLSANGIGLYVEGPVWRTMRNFSPDCSLVVLCDREYEFDHVVRDYEEFKKL